MFLHIYTISFPTWVIHFHLLILHVFILYVIFKPFTHFQMIILHHLFSGHPPHYPPHPPPHDLFTLTLKFSRYLFEFTCAISEHTKLKHTFTCYLRNQDDYTWNLWDLFHKDAPDHSSPCVLSEALECLYHCVVGSGANGGHIGPSGSQGSGL